MLDLQKYQDDIPSFKDLGGTLHTATLLSVVEEYALERQYGDFLADVLAGRVADAEFAERARPIVEGTGYPVDVVLALPADAFWEVLNDFFRPRRERGKASPKVEGKASPQAEANQGAPPPSV